MRYVLHLSVHILSGSLLFSFMYGSFTPYSLFIGGLSGGLLFLLLFPSARRIGPFPNPIRLLRYGLFTARAVLCSTLRMAYCLLTGKPLMVSVHTETPNADEAGRAVVSNSITLTPGTITLDESPSEYVILCMNHDAKPVAAVFENMLHDKEESL